ncbi:MAG TPA: type II toxin-antitoxin system RelE/ParE family toxin [Caulobacteraceae bacterium]|nr:type II toxin-antitoxin system RelE/ParE family toxin [Caulobacteraceae bacterium]
MSRERSGGPSGLSECCPAAGGVREIRVRDEAGAFRVIYVAKFAEAVFVLHCFEKKSQRTSRPDVELATRRYRDLLEELKA